MKSLNNVKKSFGKINLKPFGTIHFAFRNYCGYTTMKYRKYEPSGILNNTELSYEMMIEKEKTEKALLNARRQDDFKSILKKMEYSFTKQIPIEDKFYDLYLLATTKENNTPQFLKALDQLINRKIKPQMGTLFLTLQKLREIDELSQKKEILPILENLRQLVEEETELNSETIKILSSMARVLLKRNLIEEAEKIEEKLKQYKFQNEIQTKDKFIYVEINFRKNKEIQEACDQLLQLSIEDDDEVKSDLFLFLIKVCFDIKEYQSASHVLNYLLEKEISIKPAIFREFVELYALENNSAKLEEIIKLLINRFASRGLDQVILSNAISNLGEKKRFFPSKLIFQTVMHYSRKEEFQKSESILIKEDLLFNMMLKSAGISEKYDFMEKVFQHMKNIGADLTIHTYNILLYSFGVRLGDYVRTEQFLQEMEKRKIEKNSSTHVILSDIEKKRNKIDKFAENSEKAMEKQFFPSVKVISNHIMSNALGGNLSYAIETLEKVLQDNQVPSHDSTKALITSIAQSGNFKLAYKYLRTMNEKYFWKPNVAVAVEILRCCPTSKLEKFRSIFIEKNFISEDSNIVNNMLISRFGDEGNFERVSHYFNTMKQNKTLDLVSYKTYITRAIKGKQIELAKRIYEEMITFYRPNDPNYRDCVFFDYLFSNSKRITTSKFYFKNWNSLLLKNFTYLSFLFIQSGDFQQSVYWLDQLRENDVLLDSNRSIFLLNSFGKTRNSEYLQKLVTYIPSHLLDLLELKFALCLAHIRVGNLLECVSSFESLLEHPDLSYKQQKIDILNEIISFHSNSGNESGVEKWSQISISMDYVSLDLVNTLLKYYMKTKNLNSSFSLVEISLKNRITLDDSSFFYFFSTIVANKNENYLLAFEYFAKSGTLLDESDLSSPLAQVIAPLLRVEHKNIFKEISFLKPSDPYYVGDVLTFLNSINRKEN